MSTPTASATAAIIQATEHVIVESASAVATAISKNNAGEIKSIVSGVSKEAVAATGDSFSDIVENIEDGIEVVAGEVMKGIVAAGEAIEQHPELIIEGTIAVGLGVLSIVQPELMVGTVAMVGKMAADSAKKTVTEIAVEASSKTVAGISKEVAEEAAEITAKNAKDAAVKAVEETAKVGDEITVSTETVSTLETKEVPDIDGVAQPVTTTLLVDTKSVATAVDPAEKGHEGVNGKSHPSATVTSSTKLVETASGTQAGPVIETTNTTVVENSASSSEPVVSEVKPVALSATDVQVIAKQVAQEISKLQAVDAAQSPEPKEASASPDAEVKKPAAVAAVQIEKASASITLTSDDSSTATARTEAEIQQPTADIKAMTGAASGTKPEIVKDTADVQVKKSPARTVASVASPKHVTAKAKNKPVVNVTEVIPDDTKQNVAHEIILPQAPSSGVHEPIPEQAKDIETVAVVETCEVEHLIVKASEIPASTKSSQENQVTENSDAASMNVEPISDVKEVVSNNSEPAAVESISEAEEMKDSELASVVLEPAAEIPEAEEVANRDPIPESIEAIAEVPATLSNDPTPIQVNADSELYVQPAAKSDSPAGIINSVPATQEVVLGEVTQAPVLAPVPSEFVSEVPHAKAVVKIDPASAVTETIPEVQPVVSSDPAPLGSSASPPVAENIAAPEPANMTHAAVVAAHESIAELHQKIDTLHEALQNVTRILAAQSLAMTSSPITVQEDPVAVAEPGMSQALVLSPAKDPVVAAKRMSVFGSLGSALYGIFGASTSPAKKRQSMPVLSSMASSS